MPAFAHWLEDALLRPQPALVADDLTDLRRSIGKGRKVVIVVLGGGRRIYASEVQSAALTSRSLERLHHGVWLSRQIGAPLVYSGGVGHGDKPGTSEAEIAAVVAEKDYLRPLRWVESSSRDTRENAVMSLSLLHGERIDEVILVTHRWHMPRAVRLFNWAAQRQQMKLTVRAAPMGSGLEGQHPVLRWMPSGEGLTLTRAVWREAVAIWLDS
ncbi:MAG: YdcF family protein [Aquabacterium sp.]